MKRITIGLILSCISCALLAAPGDAHASPSDQDGAHGRLEGDVGLSFGAGIAVGPRSPRGEIDLRVRYLSAVGAYATYEDGAIFGSGAEPTRVLAGGLELRPLFAFRFLTGRETGKGRLDLAIDSVGVEIGAFAEQPQGASFGSRPGLSTGLGLELPILPSANGPWIGLHGGIRWSDAALAGEPLTGASDRALYLGITVAWHQLFGAHLVDAGDEAPQ